MTAFYTRRQFVASTALAGAAGALAPGLLLPGPARAQGTPVALRVESRVLDINGKAAKVFALRQPDGKHGLVAEAGRRFHVRLENRIEEPTLIHWHGLTPPSAQDGVPGLSQSALKPGESYVYDFPLDRPGTNWMHSHSGLQEQLLMAAPLIVRDPAERGRDEQEVVVLFHDFTFRDPAEIFAGLKGGGHGAPAPTPATPAADPHAGHGSMPMAQPMTPMMQHAMPGMNHDGAAAASGAAHLYDVEYDAFLANDRTLADPEVMRVEAGGRVRLRLINGATGTNFVLDLGALEGTLIAVDGVAVAPIKARRFDFAIAQRLDIRLELPKEKGAWPILVQREGDVRRTGIVLAARGAPVHKIAGAAEKAVPPLGLALETALRAAEPLAARAPDRKIALVFTQEPGFRWLIDGKAFGEAPPIPIKKGERVELAFEDRTTMSHPIHLHGHHFQVVAIDGKSLAGAVRDTVLVPAKGKVTVAFDAVNPGHWAIHCHNLYHMAGGMMAALKYGA